jgi:hypothetical protein
VLSHSTAPLRAPVTQHAFKRRLEQAEGLLLLACVERWGRYRQDQGLGVPGAGQGVQGNRVF